jgi:cytochrome c oxidase assembly protein subunit 15
MGATPRLPPATPPAALRNIFENTAAVQFNHRMLAYATLAGVAGMWRYGSQLAALPPAARFCLNALAAATAGQVRLLQ